MLAKYIVDGHGDLLEVNRCDLYGGQTLTTPFVNR
jgi:hypothetical protein